MNAAATFALAPALARVAAPAAAPDGDDEALLEAVRHRRPVLFAQPQRAADGLPGTAWGSEPLGRTDMQTAADRLRRFQPVLQALFPELQASAGQIESPLLPVPAMQRALGLGAGQGQLFVKADHGLPVAGSIKARGGLHEVLEFAERLARQLGLVTGEDLSPLATPDARRQFGAYQVAVGSTGNLGLSIGVIASALGFRAVVHMSADAKAWKKQRLRWRGVTVVEHEGDYAAAVAAGRAEAARDPRCHFVDDEDSLSLFLGYSAAAFHLRDQLATAGRVVDAAHPLFVYIPCGVGGAPGGITFGLAHLFGPHVHCFFAEPTASPCFLLALQNQAGQVPSVYEHGLDNRTEADGLAVPRASQRAVQVVRPALGGVFTVADETLFEHLARVRQAEGLRIEPSAAAGFDGPQQLLHSEAGRRYLQRHQLAARLPQATHIVWTTGGLFVPEEEYERFLARGLRRAPDRATLAP